MLQIKGALSSAFVIAAGALWGAIGVFGRMVASYGFTQIQVSAMRLFLGALLIVLFVLVRDKSKLKLAPRDLPVFLVLGLCSVLTMSWLYLLAIQYTSMSTAAILLYTSPIWVLAASVLFLGEKLTAPKIAALALAFAGCVCVSGLSGGGVSPVGVLCGLGSGFGYALYSIVGKKALEKYHPYTVTAYAFSIAAIGQLVLCNLPDLFNTLSQTAVPARLLLDVFLSGALTIFAPYMLYTIGLSGIQAGRASILACVEPLSAMLLGLLLYRELPGATGFIGIALILSAIVVLNLKWSGRRHGRRRAPGHASHDGALERVFKRGDDNLQRL